MKHIKLKTLICIFAILPLACKKEEKKEEIKSQFNVGGTTYNIIPQCKTALFDCMNWNANQTGFTYSKIEGLNLIFFTHYKNDLNEGYSITLDLFGVDVGLYKGGALFCYQKGLRNTSMIHASDGSGVAIFKSGSEVEITKKSGKLISGKFKLKIDYNKDFLNDSLIVGEFYDIPLN